jgi:hypothetical protein
MDYLDDDLFSPDDPILQKARNILATPDFTVEGLDEEWDPSLDDTDLL